MSAKIDLKFIDSINQEDYIKVEKTKHLLKCVLIKGIENNTEFSIVLDIPTAIRFAKTLRTEINKAKEVDNG